MSRGTTLEVQNGSGDPPKGLGRVGDLLAVPERDRGPSWRLETGQWTLGEVRDGFGGSLGRSGTSRVTLP